MILLSLLLHLMLLNVMIVQLRVPIVKVMLINVLPVLTRKCYSTRILTHAPLHVDGIVLLELVFMCLTTHALLVHKEPTVTHVMDPVTLV
jgi:hypothetical protein